MAFNTDAVETITFDSFTTIVDVGTSTRRALAEHVDPVDSIAELWRFRAIDYRMISTFTGMYETYEETTREALEYALLAHGIDLSEQVIDEIVSVFYALDVFDDVRPGMDQLADAGYDLVIVSNGNPALLDAMIESAGIDDLISGVISADEIEAYKPHPEIYTYAAEQIGSPIERIVHVATPWYDIYGAIHAGMHGVWMNRNGRPWDRFNGQPDLITRGFAELVQAFDV